MGAACPVVQNSAQPVEGSPGDSWPPTRRPLKQRVSQRRTAPARREDGRSPCTGLAADIQEEILFLPRVVQGKDPITERDLRPIAAELDWEGRGEVRDGSFPLHTWWGVLRLCHR